MTIKFDNGDYISVTLETGDHHKGWYRIEKKIGGFSTTGWHNPDRQFFYPLKSQILKEVSYIVTDLLTELAPQEEKV